MFGYSKLTSINKERYLHFKSKSQPKEAENCLKKTT